MLVKNGEVYSANLTGLNGVLSGVRAVIILDVKTNNKVLVMPIRHTMGKDKFVKHSEVEIELINPIESVLGGTDIIHNDWVMWIPKNRLMGEKIGRIKSIKFKMDVN